MENIRHLPSRLRDFASGAFAALKRATSAAPAAPASPPEPPADPMLDSVALGHEKRLREQLPGGVGKCVVGLLVPDEQALHGDDWNVPALLMAGAEVRFLSPSRGPIAEQMGKVHALMVPGGADVDPSFYGEDVNGGFPDDKRFDKFEIDCIRRGFDNGMPMLGVCRGQQVMNVAAGGSLVQDLPFFWQGIQSTRVPIQHAGNMHNMWVDPSSTLGSIFGVQYPVNSLHHQAVGLLGDKMRVTACAPDGVIEGLQREGHPFQVSVQFHPEIMQEDPKMRQLFTMLVEHGQQYPHQSHHVPARAGDWVPGRNAIELAEKSVAYQRSVHFVPPAPPPQCAPPPLPQPAVATTQTT